MDDKDFGLGGKADKASVEVPGGVNLYHLTINIKNVLDLLTRDAQNEMQQSTAGIDDPVRKVYKTERVLAYEKLFEKISVASGEAEILATLARYLELLDLERYRYVLQVKRLHDENNWLKDENQCYQNHKITLQNELAEARQAKDNYEYLYHHRKIDYDEQPLLDKSAQMDDAWGNLDIHDFEDEKLIPSQLRTVYKLVSQNVANNNFNLCHKLLNEVMQRCENSAGKESSDMAYLHDIKALVYRKEKKLAETNKHLWAACDIRKKLFGGQSLQVASTLNNISICASKLGNFTEAETACRQALDIMKACHGTNHPQAAKQLHNLGLIYTFLQKYDVAQSIFDEALKTQKSCDKQEIIATLRIESSITMCYLRSKSLDKAEKNLIQTCRDYHLHVTGHKSDPVINPDIWMIINTYHAKPQRAVDKLVESFGKIDRQNILYVIAKNLHSLFGQKNQLKHQKIVLDWLNYKPPEIEKKRGGEDDDETDEISVRPKVRENKVEVKEEEDTSLPTEDKTDNTRLKKTVDRSTSESTVASDDPDRPKGIISKMFRNPFNKKKKK